MTQTAVDDRLSPAPLVASQDGLPRCWWPDGHDRADPLMLDYHDSEWGTPVADDRARKRDAFRQAFSEFDPVLVAAYDDADRARLLANAGIVRNRAKIEATIGNAAALLAVAADYGGFAEYLALRLLRPAPVLPATATLADIPASTAESKSLSADLRRRGFRFVGPTMVYAFMQSVGLVDDHLPNCYRYRG
jgi:DNA-3-methyladenine glycosylase I